MHLVSDPCEEMIVAFAEFAIGQNNLYSRCHPGYFVSTIRFKVAPHPLISLSFPEVLPATLVYPASHSSSLTLILQVQVQQAGHVLHLDGGVRWGNSFPYVVCMLRFKNVARLQHSHHAGGQQSRQSETRVDHRFKMAP